MILRDSCLCDGKIIGIESIYTTKNGLQINIPDKVEKLRERGRKNELFCPCGCGSNLTLVAGDKNLREQHFRLKSSAGDGECKVVTEGKVSIDSRIVLKCWLDDKLNDHMIETRVPICLVDDSSRKYEFSFLSKAKNIAVSYTYNRANLSDDKIDVIESNAHGIQIIYIVDEMNGENNGQYPEFLMKIQKRQGYCLLLNVVDNDYGKAKLRAVYYERDLDDFWREITFAKETLTLFDIDENGVVLLSDKPLEMYREDALEEFNLRQNEVKKQRREKQERIKEEQERRKNEQMRQRALWQQVATETDNVRGEQERKNKTEPLQKKTEDKQHNEDFIRELKELLSQQDSAVYKDGHRWVQCEYCKKIGTEDEFPFVGIDGQVNRGICYSCEKKPEVKEKRAEARRMKLEKKRDEKSFNAKICPECHAPLKLRVGRRGRFIGCSRFPDCGYTRDYTNDWE